ncbi:hypothetical protein [Vibrio sp. 10N.247.311.51]|uniref:hypothetical protein n=1 Tax=Vibrio sp. 10N.247.311.51 TaxID=3229996 RepID=UPI00354E40FB
MNTLNFQPEVHARITELVSGIKKGSEHPFVTFIVTDKSLHLIGGATEKLIMTTLDRASDCTLDNAAFSFSATAFANLWLCQTNHIDQKETISLQLRHDNQQDGIVLEGRTELNSFRYALAQPACEHHLAFFDSVMTHPKQMIETKQALAICQLANTCTPFSVFEVNKDSNRVQIERDNDIIPFALPKGMNIDIDMALTPEAKHSLESIAQTTQSETLSVYIDDEQAMFSDGEQVYCHSLAPLRAYRERQQQHFELEAKVVIDVHEFKAERDNFQKIEEIKKTNQALLYLTPESMYFASLAPKVGALMALTTKSIITSQEQLYSVNLNALSNVRIKDITSADQVKMTVLRSAQGELKLGFHNDEDGKHPYYSVPLERALPLLPELKRIIDISQLSSDKPEQNDLFGFDDV